MDSVNTAATPTSAPSSVAHHYSNVKWYHAVNSQQQLVEASQEITRVYYGEDPPRRSSLERSSLERSPSVASASEGTAAVAPALSPPTPPYRVFGIEADVQWHPSLETAVMRHDAVPDSTDGTGTSSVDTPVEDLLTLEVFLYTVAQAVQGWRARAAAASLAPPGPLHVIVKLDFKAFKAAQLFLSQAETHTWAGLESLCVPATASRSRRRLSLRSFVSPRLESVSSGSTMAVAAPAPPSVHVELWWNADVVAQPAATPHPLSFAAAPTSEVLQLMARTAQALGHRLPFGFSLGWVLCPRVVPAAVLAEAPAHNTTAPMYVSYSEQDDVPPMLAFLDGLAQALAGTPVGSGEHGSGGVASNTPAACVQLLTFPMLFESVFADAYSEEETAEALEAASARRGGGGGVLHEGGSHRPTSAGAVEAATTLACVRGAAECRRVAAAVVAHGIALFFSSRATNSGGDVSLNAEANEESPASSSPSSSAAAAAAPESRCFPTFWKAVHPPPSLPTTTATRAWQADVNDAARAFFPYCTIDG